MIYKKQVAFSGKLIMVGFGSIGQGVLPLILRHIQMSPAQITIITADQQGDQEALHYGINRIVNPLTPENYDALLAGLLSPGDFLLNLSVDVSSIALMKWCHAHGVLYLDTCIEPWAGGYTDPNLSLAERTNYALREQMLALKRSFGKGPTLICTHGANPGLVSHWTKQAMLNIAKELGISTPPPQTREQWAAFAQTLGVKVIHCAERDTQVSSQQKRAGEFVNTWSVDGFVSEGLQPAELGFGSHEKQLPADGRKHDQGCRAAIYLERPGMLTQVRTWAPLEGAFHGYLITHAEAISIADYFSVEQAGKLIYRPTVHYAYHPCDAAVLSIHEMAGKNLQQQPSQRILMDDIVNGIDELGVLLMGDRFGAYWYGSHLSIHEARKLAPYNSATSLQVAAGVLAGMIWAIQHPQEGVMEPDDLPFEQILAVANDYLGKVVGVYSDWTPLKDRGLLFAEPLDRSDPWQFSNFRVQGMMGSGCEPKQDSQAVGIPLNRKLEYN